MSNAVGIGGLIRKWNRDLIQALCCQTEELIYETELKTCFKTESCYWLSKDHILSFKSLRLNPASGFQKITNSRSKAYSVIKYLSGSGKKNAWKIRSIIPQLLKILSHFDEWKEIHPWRIANQPANQLSEKLILMKWSVFEGEGTPHALQDLKILFDE